nr:GNAT family N-acetyltransferase [Gordonia effusa]
MRTLTTSDIAAELSVDRRGVALYPFGPEFAADSFAQMTPTLTRYMSWEPPASLAEFEPIWHRWIEDRSAGTDYVFAVTDPDSGEFLGQVGVHQANTDVPELGIWIREDRHGLGYGRKAVAAARDWANEQRDNVVAFRYPVAEDNIASRRIAEGLGGVVVDRYAGDKFPVAVYQIPVEQ